MECNCLKYLAIKGINKITMYKVDLVSLFIKFFFKKNDINFTKAITLIQFLFFFSYIVSATKQKLTK